MVKPWWVQWRGSEPENGQRRKEVRQKPPTRRFMTCVDCRKEDHVGVYETSVVVLSNVCVSGSVFRKDVCQNKVKCSSLL